MHPRLKEITDYLAAVRANLTKLVESTPPAAMVAPAPPAQWNGAQIIQHVGAVEGSIAKLFERLFPKALAEGLPEDHDTSSIVPSLERFVLVDRHFLRIEAPQPLHPAAAPDFDAVWGSLKKVRGRTLAVIATVDGHDLTKISARHPAIGVLNAYQWLLLIGQHEERHRRQILDVLALA
jgi:hypothetical protein